jgi:hypothetical protein
MGDVMADNIVEITFTNVAFVPVDGHTLSISGSINVDYTAGNVIAGPLTATLDGNPEILFMSFNFTQLDATHFFVTTQSGGNGLGFVYAGQQPTSLLEAFMTTANPVVDFTTLAANDLTSVCYVAGTLIRTPAGDVPVESLQIGDLVETSAGEFRPVKWLGHRVVDCRAHVNPRVVFPIRITQDAFGLNRPSQDLYVSTGHSICVDLCGEVLIPVGNLINGATIAQIEVDEVSYWHVELDSHDILIANNLPAESYLAMGNRGFFEERRRLLPAMLEGRERTHADFCRPVVLDGAVLDFARQRLLSRAEEIGWTPSRETDLRLMVDGEVRRPLIEGDAAVFVFPASVREVRLKSNTFIPALVGGGDPRPLGVSLTGLVFLGGAGEARSVRLNDERLQDGLHPEEGRDGLAWRWTKGDLALSPDFWEGLFGHVALHLTCNNNATRRWVAPGKAQTEVPLDKSARPKLHVA